MSQNGDRLAEGRRLVEQWWGSGLDRWSLQRRIVAESCCTDREVEILLAEREAVGRALAHGLDPSAIHLHALELLASLSASGRGGGSRVRVVARARGSAVGAV